MNPNQEKDVDLMKIFGAINNQVYGAPKEEPQTPNKVIQITSTNQFIDATEGEGRCIVDFYTQWCGPCKVIKPYFNELSNNYE